MLYFTNKKSQCTGCGACLAVCPTKCINFVSDEEGFLYPEADSNCINCGKCESVCPVANRKETISKDFTKYCVAALHRDRNIWEKSSSGGAFSAICKAFCGDEGAIFGARFERLDVVHDYVYGADNIGDFRKSKYVQSEIRDNYIKVKDILENKEKVLFSGTPCQVAGLKNFLGKEYENLLCVDLICHGVGSPDVFKKYIKYLGEKHSSKVISYTFRNKKAKMGRLLEYVVRVEFENGLIIEDDSDSYNIAFLQALFLRPSCGECLFANRNRLGDITIGDFKKKYEILSKLKEFENFSTVIVNTKKGAKIFEKALESLKVFPVNIEDILKTNPPLSAPSKINAERESFFDDLNNGMPIDKALRKYITKPGLLTYIWIHLPDRFRSKIKRWLKWIKR